MVSALVSEAVVSIGPPSSVTSRTVNAACSVEANVRSSAWGTPDAIGDAIAKCRADPFGAIAHVLPGRRGSGQGDCTATGSSHGLALSGVPFAAKNLFDVEGLPTYAGGPFDRDLRPATADATAIARLTAQGATLVATTHMDEYAYGFLGRNPHHGSVVNPRTPECIAGGSSGGSAAAVAAGLVPLALGSDTNGSIRVPAALCGVFGIKPGFDRVSRTGVRSLAPSLDHVGLLAAHLDLLEVAYGVLADQPPARLESIDTVSIGVAGGDFETWCEPEVWRVIRSMVPAAADAIRLDMYGLVDELAAASIITAVEAYRVHATDLEQFPHRYSAQLMLRLRAGADVDHKTYERAKDIQARVRDKYLAWLARADVLITPALPVFAPRVGAETVTLRGVDLLVSDALSLFTRPFSLAGLPVVVVPLLSRQYHGVGIQLVCAPGSERKLWAAARQLLAR